jgi:hypothetical protein
MSQWPEKLLFLDKECIVVGLGSGQHIADLVRVKNLQKIYVVDTREDLVEPFRAQFPELMSVVEIFIVASPADLLKHEIMTVVIEKNLSAYAHTASWPKGDLTLAVFHRHLTGRSQESLQLFFNRKGIKQEVRLSKVSGEMYLSIKDLEVLIQEDVSPYLRLNCFRILKELII